MEDKLFFNNFDIEEERLSHAVNISHSYSKDANGSKFNKCFGKWFRSFLIKKNISTLRWKIGRIIHAQSGCDKRGRVVNIGITRGII